MVIPTKHPRGKSINLTTKRFYKGTNQEAPFQANVVIYGVNGGKAFVLMRVSFATYEARNKFWMQVKEVGHKPKN